MSKGIVSAVCYVHLKYGLCSRRCQRKGKCLLQSHDSKAHIANHSAPATEPLLLFSSEEERSRARRLWQAMNTDIAIARMVR